MIDDKALAKYYQDISPRLRNYPKNVDVGSSIWKTKFCRNIPHRGDIWGLNDPEKQINYIQLGIPRFEAFVTWLHEHVHSMEDEYGFQFNHDMLDIFDIALARFMLDNRLELTALLWGKKP